MTIYQYHINPDGRRVVAGRVSVFGTLVVAVISVVVALLMFPILVRFIAGMAPQPSGDEMVRAALLFVVFSVLAFCALVFLCRLLIDLWRWLPRR